MACAGTQSKGLLTELRFDAQARTEEPRGPEHVASYGRSDQVLKLFRGKDPRLRQPQEKGVYFGLKENETLKRTVGSPLSAGVSIAEPSARC